MPYIKPKDRDNYIEHLDKIVSELADIPSAAGACENNLGGHLNFCISYLLARLFEEREQYVRINTLMGAIEGAKQEFYRFHVVPYEEIKRQQNGDV